MVAELIAIFCLVVVALAEWLHSRRCRSLWRLIFAGVRPPVWIQLVPWVRVVACGVLCWGLIALLTLPSSAPLGQHDLRDEQAINECYHVVVILDVSPSMRIEDAGTTGVQKRSQRAIEVMNSIFERTTRDDVRYSLVAVYTDARPVLVASRDAGVLRNIMEFPLSQAFTDGKTNLRRGVEVAFDLAHDWASESTTFILLTDGDTIGMAEEGLPKAPRALHQFLVAGLGTRRGAFIDGHQSRQDRGTLQYMAARFGGTYHDVNARHFPTLALDALTSNVEKGTPMKLTRKHLALAACGGGALILALIPILLNAFGFNLSKNLATRRVLLRGGAA